MIILLICSDVKMVLHTYLKYNQCFMSKCEYLSDSSQLPPVIKAYDDAMQGPLKAFLDVSKKISGEVAQMVF